MDFVPLPRTSPQIARQRSLPSETNANIGLVFNKFFNCWDRKGDAIAVTQPMGESGQESGKFSFLNAFAGPVLCEASAVMAERIAQLAAARGGRSERFVTTAPMVTGLGLPHPVENGFLWHHTLGVPYLPGSSVKGLMRRWITSWLGDEDLEGYGEHAALVNHLFGSDNQAAPSTGALVVLDALPVADLSLIVEVVTPHDGGWRLNENVWPADWLSPTPIPFLAVGHGAVFQFALASRTASAENVSIGFELLTDALDWLGAGAKTSSGFGRFAESERPLQVGDKAFVAGLGPAGITVVVEGFDGEVVLCAHAETPTQKYKLDRSRLRRLAS